MKFVFFTSHQSNMKTVVVTIALLACAFAVPAQNGMSRMIGGNQAEAGQFPSTASLQFRSGGVVFSHVCAATIISPDWCITAAQCRDSFDLSRYRVVAGLLNQGQTNPGVQITSIEEFILHPDYHGGKGKHDIGLIYLTKPLQWTDTVGPAKLPASGSEPSGDGTVSSWGSDTALQWTDAHLLSHDDCVNALNEVSGSHDPFDDTQTCTSDKTPICHDDRGAPFVQDGTALGIHSWSIDECETQGAPAVFVRVDSHLDFIHEHVGDM